VRLRPLERAAFFSAYSEKKLKHIIQGSSGAFGNGGAGPGESAGWSRPRGARIVPTTAGSSTVAMRRSRAPTGASLGDADQLGQALRAADSPS